MTGYNLKYHVAHIWKLMGQVQSLKLAATTGDRRSFFHNATAMGSVAVSKTENRVITFHEKGSWKSTDGQTADFRNIYRWSLSDRHDTIRLMHLRYGADHPVHLVDFAAEGGDILQSFQPHRCGDDRYSANLSASQGCVFLRWTIQGPAKDDTIVCQYFSTEKVYEIL